MRRRSLLRAGALLPLGAAAAGTVGVSSPAAAQDARAAADGTDRYVPLPTGVRLHYVASGTGHPVVFIPGWTCTTGFFSHQLPYFAADFRAVSYDPRSQGRSEKTMEGNSFTQRGADLNAFLSALDLTGVTLVGWSYGSYDMWAYLEQFGADRVAGVVVLDEPPKSWAPADDTTDWSEAPLTPDGMPDFIRSVIDDRVAFWTSYAKYMIGLPDSAPDDDPTVQWIVQQGMLTPQSVATQLIADGTTSDFSVVAADISDRVPTLVFARQDWADTARSWVSANMPKAAFDVTPVHMGFYVQPDQFNQQLGDFLATVYG